MLSITFICPILILEKEPVFSLLCMYKYCLTIWSLLDSVLVEGH